MNIQKFDWRSADDAAIEHHFNPRLTIPNALELLGALPKRAAAARLSLAGQYDLAYGPGDKDTFDLFPAEGGSGAAQIFIHGGYWRAMDKSDHSHLAVDVTGGGVTHISLNYDLCPDVTLDDITGQVRRAIVHIFNHAAQLGVDPARLHISGHSAGGHLTGMMMATNWPEFGLPKDVFKSATPISGVFEPEAVMHTSINDDVRLDPDMARRNSALAAPPMVNANVMAVVGGDEPAGFHEQSEAYVDLCRGHGMDAEFITQPGCNHFTVLDALFDKDGVLHGKMMAMMV
ncbi:MAG: alpha/beta hydrolase [Rhodospirillales bacterium]|nr:alpha/beta hydrolase [Rhodospirillales bacterium]